MIRMKKKRFKPRVNIVKACDKIRLRIRLTKTTWLTLKSKRLYQLF